MNTNVNIIKETSKKLYNRESKVVPIWLEKLDRNKDGIIKNTFNNFKAILENDEDFAGKIKFNEFSGRPYIQNNGELSVLDDNKITDMLIKIEKKYDGINKRNILEQVVDLVAEKHKYNPILDYLNGLKWDGVPRLATAFSDYFGCEHSKYNEYCFRVFLNGAIARVLNPGVKFDYMLTLYGDQRAR